MTRSETAKKYFTDGYNCAQAVVLAFSDLTDIDEKSLVMLASSFGGGMGRLREVCGAVSGAFAVLGLTLGYSSPTDKDKKAEHYANIQEFARRFSEKTGSIVCRELLSLSVSHDTPVPEKRTAEYYKKRPCADLVELSAELLEEFLTEKGVL